MAKLSHRQVQKLVKKLCTELHIPIIPVKKVDDFDEGNLAAFYTDPYEIKYVEEGATADIIGHEVGHYAVHLIHIAEELEEAVCDRFGSAIANED